MDDFASPAPTPLGPVPTEEGPLLVAGSRIQMRSMHASRIERSRVETVRIQVDTASISPAARQPPPREDDDRLAGLSAKERNAIRVLEMLLARVTGRKVRLRIVAFRPPNAGPPPTRAPERVSVQYEFHETYREREATSVDMRGTIRTEDGRDVDFAIDLDMRREFLSERWLRQGGAAPTDPLVINLGHGAARLSSGQFEFDLDADGDLERTRFPADGGVFLARDLDGDGAIRDGSELFGPRSGNGFAELASLDQDGDSWIDARDGGFASLRTFTKDASGADVVRGLAESGVSALYTGNIASPFALKDEQNRTQGVIRSTGVYLASSGTVGTVQQLDVAL